MTVFEIDITNWERFQAYDKSTIWIRLYTRLLSDDNFLDLTWPQRGILVSLWLEYARANHGRPVGDTRAIRGNTAALTRRLGGRVTSVQLEALNHAGFITLSSRAGLKPVKSNSMREEKRTTKSSLLPT